MNQGITLLKISFPIKHFEILTITCVFAVQNVIHFIQEPNRELMTILMILSFKVWVSLPYIFHDLIRITYTCLLLAILNLLKHLLQQQDRIIFLKEFIYKWISGVCPQHILTVSLLFLYSKTRFLNKSQL